MAGAKLGLDCILYRRTVIGVDPTPDTYVEVGNVKDASLNLTKDLADVTVRANDGWKAQKGTLKNAEVTFKMIVDASDDNYTAFADAFFDNTPVHIRVADGDVADDGTQYLEADMDVTSFTRSENLTEAVMVDVTLVPTYSATPPSWTTVDVP